MEISRRQFIKSAAAQSAVTAAAVLFPGISFGAWKKLDPSSGGIIELGSGHGERLTIKNVC